MWRRSILIFAVLFGALAGVGIALKSPRVAENIKATIIQIAHDRYHADVEIGRLEIELVPPGLAVETVRVGRLDADKPWLELHRGHIVVRPWPSPSGAFVIDHLDLDGLTLTLDLRAAALPAEGPGAQIGRAKSRVSIDINELFLFNTAATLETDAGEVTLHGLDLALRPSRGGRDIAVDLAEGVLSHAGRRVGFEAKARGRFLGSLDRPEKLTLERAFLNLRELAVGARGEVLLAGKPALDLSLAAQAPLSRLNDFVADLPALGGLVHASIDVRGTPKAPEVHADVSIDDTQVGRALIGQVEVQGTYTADQVKLDSFKVENRHAGTITGSGQLQLAPGLPVTFATRLHSASLPHILELAGLKDSWVPLFFSGDVQVTGALSPFKLQLAVNGTAEHFAVRDRSYKAADAVEHLSIPTLDVSGPVTITDRAVAIRGVQVKIDDSRLEIDGSLSYDESQGLDLRASGDAFDLAVLGPVAFVPFAGRGAVAATIKGPYANPTVSGTVDMIDFATYGISLGATKGTVTYSGRVLEVNHAQIRHDQATIEGSVRFHFETPGPEVEGEAMFQRLALSDILFNIGFSSELARRFEAAGSGSVRVSGPLLLPIGNATFSASELKLDGVSVGRCELASRFGADNEIVAVDIKLTPEAGSFTSHITWLHGNQMSGNLDAREISLALVRPFIGDIPVTGILTGTGHFAGPPDALSGRARATIQRLNAYGTRLETSELSADLERGEMQVEGTVLSDGARVKATLNLGRRIPYTFTATTEDLEVGRLWPLGRDFRLQVSGTLFSQGDLTSAESMMADAELDRTTVSWGGLALRSARPVRLQYAALTLRVADLLLANDAAQLQLDGSLTTSGAIDLHAKGQGELKAGGAISNNLEFLRGRFDLTANVTGTWDAPRFSGGLILSDGAMRLSTAGQILDQLNAKIGFTGRTLDIASGSASLGGGGLQLGGQILLPIGAKPELNLRADLNSVTLRPTPDLTTTLSGFLNLVGPSDDLLLRGRIRLASLRYTTNLDLEHLIPRRNAPPIRVPAFEPEAAIRLAVAVQAPNNLILSSNVVEAEFQADLTVTGTTERVGLIGPVTPLWAKARYHDNLFKLERGTIDFSEEYRIFTQFDLRATTEACAMKIAVDIHGNSDQYNVIPSGQDATGTVTPQDVLACLQFGMRLRDFEIQGRTPVAQTPGSTGGGALSDPYLASGLDVLWTVSGVDATVKRLLPIKLDEVRLESGWSSHYRHTSTRVLVGKELGANLQLKYSRALDEPDDQSLSMQYRLSKTAALQGTWLGASDVVGGDFGMDLRLHWELR